MSELREAAQAALEHWDKVSGIFRMTTETNRLRAALAQPEATAADYDLDAMAEAFSRVIEAHHSSTHPFHNPIDADAKIALRTLRGLIPGIKACARPPRDEWRPASEPPDTPPHDYLLKKLAMVMPLFEEARDALTAISEQQRAVRCISPTLADRMDAAGTYSIDDWRDIAPPTE